MNEEKFLPEQLMKIVDMENTSLKGTDGKTLKDVIKEFAEECKAATDADK